MFAAFDPGWWLIGLAVLLRFVNLGGESLWYDESFTAWLSRLDFPHLWAAILGDVHPPAYYLLSWINVHLFGDSAVVLRLPSAVAGVLAVWLVYRLALAVGLDRRVAVVAGLLAALLPGAIYYSQEARMYAIYSCCTLLAVFGVVTRRWWLYFLAGLALPYLQNVGLFYVAALALGGLLLILRLPSDSGYRDLRRWALASLGIGLGWLPWAVGGFLGQMGAVKAGYWVEPLTLGGWLQPWTMLTMGWRMADRFTLHVYAVALGLSLVGLVVGRSWLKSRSGIVVAVVCFLPVVAVGLVSAWWGRSIFVPRSMLPSDFLLMLIWAFPLVRLSPPNRRIAWVVVGLALGIGLTAHYFTAVGRDDLNSWLGPVRADFRAGDVIYHSAIHTAVNYSYYLPGLPYFLRPYASDLNQTLSEESKAAMGFPSMDFDALAASGRYARIWLIVYTNPMSRSDELAFLSDVVGRYRAHLVESFDVGQAVKAVYLVDLAEF